MTLLPKRSQAIGWDDTAFQLWDSMVLWQPLCLPSVPLIGKYAAEYEVSLPFVLVKLPPSASEALPKSLIAALEQGDRSSGSRQQPEAVEPLQIFLLVHAAPSVGPDNDINFMPHAWAMPHLDSLDASVQAMVQTGIWPLCGIAPKVTRYTMYDRDADDNYFGAAPFEKIRERLLHVHDGCISPNNMGFCLQAEGGLCSFFSATASGPHRAIALHVVPCDEKNEDQLRKAATNAADASSLISFLPDVVKRLGSEDAGIMVKALLQALVDAADVRLVGQEESERLVAAYAESLVHEGIRLPAWPVLERDRFGPRQMPQPGQDGGAEPPTKPRVEKASPTKPPEQPLPAYEESDGHGASEATLAVLDDSLGL